LNNNNYYYRKDCVFKYTSNGILVREPKILYLNPTGYSNLKNEYEDLQKNWKVNIMYFNKFVEAIDILNDRFHLKTAEFQECFEWTLHPQIIEIIEYLKKEKFYLKGTTNGTVLNTELRKIIISSFEEIVIKLDTYDRMAYKEKKEKDYFPRILSNLENLLEERDSADSKLKIGLEFGGINNMEEFVQIISFADRRRVDFVKINNEKMSNLHLQNKISMYLKNVWKMYLKRIDFLRPTGNYRTKECKFFPLFLVLVVNGDLLNCKRFYLSDKYSKHLLGNVISGISRASLFKKMNCSSYCCGCEFFEYSKILNEFEKDNTLYFI